MLQKSHFKISSYQKGKTLPLCNISLAHFMYLKINIGHALLQKNNGPGPQLEKSDTVPVSDADLQ